jgi:eukaryotic-like serine/threonine-protein kinase
MRENLHCPIVTLGTIGELIANRYRLQEFLGRGTYGEVWRAVDEHRSYEATLGPHQVALKLILNRDRSATWREASILTALESEHILKVNNADMSIDVPYLDTALADCSLDARSEPYGAEPGLVVTWIRRALRGLELCHQYRLLHRDIKPANIFLGRGGDAKLGDFGAAALMDGDGTAEISGDMRLRAPELFSGGRASVASDIYAAACTLYALVSGRLPFAGITQIADLTEAVTKGSYPPVRDVAPHVSQALADKIKTGMALDPLRRFSSAAEFDNALVLPARARRFTPIPLHSGHLRCWQVSGQGQSVRVCVHAAADPKCFTIETRYESSRNRIRQHCLDSVAERELAKRLRAIFNSLR